MRFWSFLLLTPLFAFDTAPKPLFEVILDKRPISNGIEFTYTLINNSGRRITGVEVMVDALPNNGSVGVNVIEFPKGTDTSATRIPLPSSGAFTSSEPNYSPECRPRVVRVVFADGSQWSAPPSPDNSKTPPPPQPEP